MPIVYSLESVLHTADQIARADLARVANRLMKEACTYASLKLAEVEARARFLEKIHLPS